MKADKYLESIGLGNVIDEEFFNDDDKSWYKVQELMESYHQSKLDLLTVPVVVEQSEQLADKNFDCFEYSQGFHRCFEQCKKCKDFS